MKIITFFYDSFIYFVLTYVYVHRNLTIQRKVKKNKKQNIIQSLSNSS